MVVGAANHAGWSIAERIADGGASLVLADDDHGALTRLAQHLEDNFDTAVVTSQRDIAGAAAVDHIAQQALTIFGRVDALVVVLSGGRGAARRGCAPDEANDEIALLSAATLAVLPTMLVADAGRVVYAIGGPADGGLEERIDRAAACGAAHAVAADLARAFATYGMTFNVVDMSGQQASPQTSQASPAAVVAFLAGAESAFANGQFFGTRSDACASGSIGGAHGAAQAEFRRAEED